MAAHLELEGKYGIATLDSRDWNYFGYYNNRDDSDRFNIGGGFNYHQGPVLSFINSGMVVVEWLLFESADAFLQAERRPNLCPSHSINAFQTILFRTVERMVGIARAHTGRWKFL